MGGRGSDAQFCKMEAVCLLPKGVLRNLPRFLLLCCKTQICRQAAKEDKKENRVIHQIFKLQPPSFIKKILCELAQKGKRKELV